jgi:phosphoribosylformylglycinamidine synthase
MPDIRKAATMDLKEEGNPVYMVSETKDEMGGSHFYMIKRRKGGRIPGVEFPSARMTMEKVTAAIDRDVVRACHDCSEGGLAVAAAEMCFAGGLGMKIDLRKVPQKGIRKNYKLLFSESNSRFLVEVGKAKAHEFEKIMERRASRIGEVTPDKKLIVTGLNGGKVVNEDVDGMKRAWQKTFDW